VTLVGAFHDRPSADIATTALLEMQPGLKRQSCHVAQTRPDASTSAAGSGKKRSPRAGRTWSSAIVTGAAKLAAASEEIEDAMRLSSERKTTTSSPVGRITGNAPTALVAEVRTGADHVAPPSTDDVTASELERSVSVYAR
jgi:hypothetical protein